MKGHGKKTPPPSTTDAETETVINGTIERIIFLNEENDYTVVRFLPEMSNKSSVAVGYLGGLQPGENFQFTGEWMEDPRFGEQFKVKKFRIIYPSTEKGLINFLSSGLIHGIGKGYAERIVSTFGQDTLKIISEHPERLNEVRGLGEKRIVKLVAGWKEHYAVRDIMMFLQSYDISAAYASKIFKQYGFTSIDVVKSNPYRLATEVSGIGFISADKISQAMGIPEDSPMRIEAGILHAIGKMTEEGHVYIPMEDLKKTALLFLKCSEELLKEGIARLLAKGSLIQRKTSHHQDAVYPTQLLKAEEGVVSHYERLMNAKSPFAIPDPEKEILMEEERIGMQFSPAQKQALALGLSQKTLVITGGPGTGKTTIIRTLVDIFKNHHFTFLLAAPTGRASKRLAESTGCEAKTIHRLLEYNPKFNVFNRNDGNPLETEAVIIDEASMIDILLMYHLMEAIPPQAVFILIGDRDQLPSVGPGKVLTDVIHSNAVPFICLDTIFRQAEGSEIILNAHRINRGENLDLNNAREGNFFFIEKEDPASIVATLEEVVCERIPQGFGFNPTKDVQVLTPMHKTDMGVTNLNLLLQKRLNPNPKIQVRRHLNIAVGDKVMQTSNNYEKDIFNGDMGFIESIDDENQIVFIRFEQRIVEYSYAEMDDILLSYAITIHKSQGSEYGAVVIPITTHHYTMLQRNLLYTAVTRGKKLVVLIGTKKALYIAVKNSQIQNRYSDLESKLAVLKEKTSA